MRKALLASALLLVGLVGCGGGGTDTIQGSPFAGQWSGGYTTTTQTGTARVTITPNGRVAGTGRNTTLGLDFEIVGEIDNTGSFTGTISGDLNASLDGTLTISKGSHLTGLVHQRANGTTIVSQFDLSPQ